ncbi:MAG: PQQ-dependent sugar dehydrogenase, partial [Cytophagaceae bacterium]
MNKIPFYTVLLSGLLWASSSLAQTSAKKGVPPDTASQLPPVETQPPVAIGQKPAFDGQTRAP